MSSPLLVQIMDSCKNEKLLSITKTHICTLLKYSDEVSKKGSAAFFSKEEYQEFAIAKFYVDKCISSLETHKVHIEEGEISNDSSVSDQAVTEAEEIPSLESFHLSPLERKKRLYYFWKNVKEGEIYHAKVVGITDLVYELILVNKYLSDERLIDISINACMKKSSSKENLNISDLMRAYVHSYTTTTSGTFKLVMSADTAEIKIKIENTKLGKISKTELPFPPLETCKFRSLTQYIAAHCNDRNPEILINKIKSLDIDPYKTYSLIPELNSKKSIKQKEKTDISTLGSKAIKALKEAMFWKGKGDVLRALSCANTALDLEPNYDLALAIRGTLYEMKADGKTSSLLQCAVKDYISALQINDRCQLALKQASDMLLRSSIMYLEEGAFKKTRENLEHSLRLRKNEEAKTLMMELNLYERKHPNTVEDNENLEDSPVTI